MPDFVKIIYDNDDLEIYRPAEPSSELAGLKLGRARQRELLQDCLSPDDQKVLEEYDECNNAFQSEVQYRAFRCGMKCAARLFLDILER